MTESSIPPEAKALREEFLAQQAQEEAKRTAVRAVAKKGSELKGGPITSSEMARYARMWGCQIETGGGKHGTHIVAPNERKCSLPWHGEGKTLATGTQHSIRSFIKDNGVSPN